MDHCSVAERYRDDAIAAEYALRRRRLLDAMPPHSAAIVRTSSEVERTFGTRYAFRPRSSFYYLTGFDEPDACAVFLPGRAAGEFVLFCRPANPGRELLQGSRIGERDAIARYGAHEAFDVASFSQRLPALLEGRVKVFYQLGVDDAVIGREVTRCVTQLQGKVRAGVTAPAELLNLDTLLQEFRFRKSAAELAQLRRAVEISVSAHERAMARVRPGMYEYELEAELVYEMIRARAVPAYPPVVCSSTAGCVMHHREDNTRRMADGDLVIVDAAGEYDYYSADLARTYPVNGKFTREQRAIYELVLHAQTSMISLARPGIGFDVLQQEAESILTYGLTELGLLTGEVARNLSEKGYKKFFPHNIGHWIGMDVHDEISYRHPCGEWRHFESGALLTVEPAIYVRPGDESVDSRWWNIGVHIEDVVLVTDDGNEVLSDALARSVSEIEAVIGRC